MSPGVRGRQGINTQICATNTLGNGYITSSIELNVTSLRPALSINIVETYVSKLGSSSTGGKFYVATNAFTGETKPSGRFQSIQIDVSTRRTNRNFPAGTTNACSATFTTRRVNSGRTNISSRFENNFSRVTTVLIATSATGVNLSPR